jgi:hypothetical protein
VLYRNSGVHFLFRDAPLFRNGPGHVTHLFKPFRLDTGLEQVTRNRHVIQQKNAA